MIIRQALNFTAHLVAGVAVGALAVTAYKALKRRDDDGWVPSARAVEQPPARPDEHDEAAGPR